METPEYIKAAIKGRLDDGISDEEIDSMEPMEKLQHVCGWELGDEQWADQFVEWARACGMQVEFD